MDNKCDTKREPQLQEVLKTTEIQEYVEQCQLSSNYCSKCSMKKSTAFQLISHTPFARNTKNKIKIELIAIIIP
uniref:Uncharacterized protein n=1 Tax=Solanum tuberosum TaxID=4113 RepID=M1D4M3_SOLTU